MSYSIPPPEHSHTWAEVLTLVGAIRRIAYDVTLEVGDAMRRIRDLYAEHDAGGASTWPAGTTARIRSGVRAVRLVGLAAGTRFLGSGHRGR